MQLECQQTGYVNEKPMLDPIEMVNHLKTKGVKFDIISVAEAIEYLTDRNNYFKLTAYRKNYSKHPEGSKKGQYIDLDFAYLVELSILDMRLRYILIHMCLDVEHYLKLSMLSTIEKNRKQDAYTIVSEYKATLSPNTLAQLNRTISPIVNNDIYRRSLINKHRDNYPIWAFAEIIPFNELIHIYSFVSKKYACYKCEHVGNSTCQLENCKQTRRIGRINHMLNAVRSIRNACAHNSCILNDLHHDEAITAQLDVKQHLYKFLTARYVQSKLRSPRIQQIVTLMYMHDLIVTSKKIKDERYIELKQVVCERFQYRKEYFSGNSIVADSLNFLKNVIDKWQKV